MKTIAEYAEKFRKDPPFRYAVAFGEMEAALMRGEDLAEQLHRLKVAMDEVEQSDA